MSKWEETDYVEEARVIIAGLKGSRDLRARVVQHIRNQFQDVPPELRPLPQALLRAAQRSFKNMIAEV